MKCSAICQICLQPKSYKKYRRLLGFHSKRGDLSPDSIDEIIFQTKATRGCSKSTREGSSISGRIRCLDARNETCGAYVLDLHNHLTRTHGLMSSEQYIQW